LKRILHLIPLLNFGGASRAAIAVASECGSEDEIHAIASIRPSLGRMAARSRAHGIDVLDAPPRPDLLRAIGEADVTLVHLWNSPELQELLESELPPCRLVVWSHVAGDTATQFVPPEIFRRAGETIATSQRAAHSVRKANPELEPVVIPPVGGWERIEGVTRSSRAGFNVGYIGTVAFTRLRQDFVRLSLAADDVRFIVCGDGSAGQVLRRQARELGASDRFDFRGQIGEIRPALSDFDVFGYPLRADTSASSDLSLKETMYAGVPPIVLAGTQCEELVAAGETGVVAAEPAAYAREIERLRDDPSERERLARNGHAYAVENWTPSRLAPAWKACFERAMSRPARAGPVLEKPDSELPEGAARFVRGLGEWGRDFELSLSGSPAEAEAADQRIEDCDPLLAYEDNGLFDHRRRYPEEPMLALWTGLFLKGQGHPALGAGELARARRLGCDPTRIARHASPAGAA
jgi:glycosyltransferase involved in cell wall biosynthesis